MFLIRSAHVGADEKSRLDPLRSSAPIAGKSIVAKFDGGLLSSDGGVPVLREVEQRLRVADPLAGRIEDPRDLPTARSAMPMPPRHCYAWVSVRIAELSTVH